MRFIITLILISIIQSAANAGGGWVLGKGKGFYKLSQNVIRADGLFNPNGDVIDIPTISLYTTSLYGEFGLNDRLNLIGYVPLFVRSTQNTISFNQSGNTLPGQEKNTLLGDALVGVKYGFFQDKKVVMAAGLMLGLPFGDSEVTSENILQTGDGEFNQLLSLEASRSFYPAPFYASAYIGFNNRTKGFSEEVHLGGEIGFVKAGFAFIMKVKNISSLYNGGAGANGSNGVFANNTEFFSYTPEIAYNVSDQFGVSGSAGFAFSGKRILAAPNFGIGLFLKI
ncbi:MAG: hypothetical protein ACI83W_001884 [Marinoscillum sp.]|jgi:hypothetical protein